MSKPRIPYFDFYPADFMHGIRGLTAQEVGIYTMLLCRIYEENGPVEYHAARLSTYCGTRESTFTKAFERLVDLGKFTVADGCFMNPRAEREIETRKTKLENNSRAGKISAEKKQQNQRKNATTVQRTVNHTDTDTDKDTGKNTPLPPKGGDEADFLMFWESYPHRAGAKKNRKGALAKWRAAIKRGVTAEDMMAGVERMKADPTVARGYARDAVTWLNQEGWTDEIAAQPSNVIPMPGRTVLPNGDVDLGNGWVWTPGDPYEYNLKSGDVRDAKHIRDRRAAEADLAMRGCI